MSYSSRLGRWPSPLALALALVISVQASADAPERGGVQLRYGVAMRAGSQTDAGPGVRYGGLTPNDLSLGAHFFSAGGWGGRLLVQREAFALLDDEGAATSGALVRAQAGPSARWAFGPLGFDLLVGYQLAQLPSFESSAIPALRPGVRHAALGALRARGAFGRASIEARGELPVSLSARDALGARATSNGFAVGGAVGLTVLRVASTRWRALLDYQYVTDSLRSASGAVSTQRLSRLGVGLELQWAAPEEAARAPVDGALELVVVDGATEAGVENAAVAVQSTRDERELRVGKEGRAVVEALGVGAAEVRVTAEGYQPAGASAEVRAGDRAVVKVRLTRVPSAAGGLKIVVTDKESSGPLEGVSVKALDAEYFTDEAGAVALVGLVPGPMALRFERRGYRPGKEATTIVAGQNVQLAVALLKDEKRAVSTLTGLVRSTAGGGPVSATLELPEAKLKVRAGADGAFALRLPGGTYAVNISAPGFFSQVKTLTVRDGDQTVLNVDLRPR